MKTQNRRSESREMSQSLGMTDGTWTHFSLTSKPTSFPLYVETIVFTHKTGRTYSVFRIPISPIVQSPSNSILVFRDINTSSDMYVIYMFNKHILKSFPQVVDKDIKWNSSREVLKSHSLSGWDFQTTCLLT